MFDTLKRTVDHIRWVQEMMLHIVDGLRTRMLLHDQSKFTEEEFRGYMRFEDMPKGLKYGSEEYAKAMAKVMEGNDCFDIHALRNDHHPEHYDNVEDMGLLAVIEMVCDWGGAKVAYGNVGDWGESVKHNIKRFGFTPEQQWVIWQVATILEHTVMTNTLDPDQEEKDYLGMEIKPAPAEKEKFFDYVEEKIQKCLRENPHLEELYLDERVEPDPDDKIYLMEWKILIRSSMGIYEDNWKAWVFGAGQTMLAALEDAHIPGTKWRYAAIHQNDDLDSRTFVGFHIGLLRTTDA